MSSIVKQKLVKIDLLNLHPDMVAYNLTNAASEGYCYGGHATQMIVTGGAIYILRYGVYTINCFFWLNSAPGGSLFHAWRIGSRSGIKLLEKELDRIIEHENSIGFSLVALIPMEAFIKDEAGPGTACYYALFERSAESKSHVMLDKWTLKQERLITEEGVPCPVIGCNFVAPKMSANGINLNSKKEEKSICLCPIHRIYISPSTFEYEEPTTSILWHEDKETVLILSKSGKRTWSRMGRERDEDSLVWNVFRFLERENLFKKFFESNISLDLFEPVEKLIYWSVDMEKAETWEVLKEARKLIGENPSRGSEPDIIIVFGNAVILVEAKLDSESKDSKRSKIPSYYEDKDGIFKNSIKQVTDSIGYELMRFFLLGEALKKLLKKRTLIVFSITQEDKDKDLETRVNDSVNLNFERLYYRITWNQVCSFIEKVDVKDSLNRKILSRYLRGKTLGYDESGKLRTLLQ